MNKLVVRFSRYYKIIISSVILSGTAAIAPAQDIQFSQFYAVTPYINPAFVGGTHSFRAMAHGRLQWPGLDAKYETGLVSVDHYFEKYNSGVGVMVLQDQQGLADIKNTTATLQYSYELPITKAFTIRGGLRGGYSSQSINFSQLYLPSQIDDQTGQHSTGVTGLGNQKGYLDLGSGFLGYTERIWGSVAFDHMNTPSLTMYGTGDRAPLPMKTSFTAGYKIPLKGGSHMAYLHEANNIFLTPTAHYKMQGKSDQFDMGLYLTYNQFLLGAWYRGIEFKRIDPKVYNSESAVASIGWIFYNWSIQYSYDITVSTLTRAGTGGSHELNITYVYHKPSNKHKPMKRLPCPDFYHSNKHQK
ncbi:MAG TPA: type IX secretion system membrane protein PorP/SprF [Cytophagaceae bacterium]|nr:type IX secretion system membrane protein PorP/SprF [Cytophagaceae bacterium]